jgi:outer membrane protein assembly factor BamB
VVDFDRKSSARGDPREEVGAIFVVSRDGELLAELNPGGWLCEELVVTDAGALLASVNDSGPDYRTPEPGERLVALELDGTMRWDLANGYIGGPPAVSDSGTVYVPIETAYSERVVGATESHLLAVDLETGSELWQYDCGDAPVADLAVGQDGTVYCATKRTWPQEVGEPGASNFNPAAANQLGRLLALSGDGKLRWSTALGCAYQSGLALGPNDEIYLIGVEWSLPEQSKRLFECTWWLKAYGSGGQQLWQYTTDYETQLYQLAADSAGNVYLSGVWVAGWNPGVVAVSSQGEERWIYYSGGEAGPITVSDSGSLLLAVDNSITELVSAQQ